MKDIEFTINIFCDNGNFHDLYDIDITMGLLIEESIHQYVLLNVTY